MPDLPVAFSSAEECSEAAPSRELFLQSLAVMLEFFWRWAKFVAQRGARNGRRNLCAEGCHERVVLCCSGVAWQTGAIFACRWRFSATKTMRWSRSWRSSSSCPSSSSAASPLPRQCRCVDHQNHTCALELQCVAVLFCIVLWSLSSTRFVDDLGAIFLQLDLKDAWKEVRITNDEKNEEPDGAPESKSAKSGGKAVTPRPSSSSARGAKLNNAFQVHAAQIGAQTVYHTTLSISLAGRGEELYRTINAQPYLACCLFETAKADPSEDAAERAKRAEGSRPVQGFAIDVSPLLTAVGEVHATCVVGERMCGVKQIGFACGCTPSGEGVGPMISASVAPSYSPITLAIDKYVPSVNQQWDCGVEESVCGRLY